MIEQWKIDALEKERQDREVRRKEHKLREVLFELTDACNLSCLHCGTSCISKGNYLDIDAAKKMIEEIKGSYGSSSMRISFTGGEPLLHPRFMEFAEFVGSLGFAMGMTTNATLITEKVAFQLRASNVADITVSIDGMEKTHDAFRNKEGSWSQAMAGIDNLFKTDIVPSITTVANKLNIDQLEDMYHMFQDMGIELWRVLNIDPIGRALLNPELLLDNEDYQKMIWFIEDKRINYSDAKPFLTASCSHYLGPIHEGETRNWIFSCRSGTTVASVTAKGEYVGCLDVDRRPDLIEGYLGKDSFIECWENRYKTYRRSRVQSCEMCMNCEHKDYCDGDSMHTWDFDHNIPKLCIGAK